MNWKHDELMHDLADHLIRPERMLWTDMQLGPSGSPRPDVFTMFKSYTQPKPMAYEVKVSVSDFRSDVTKGKWQSYLDYAAGVYFAVPKGLITKKDLPKGVGLMVRSENGWSTTKAPTLQKVELDPVVMTKLLIDGIERYQPERRGNYYKSLLDRKRMCELFGQDVAGAINDLQEVRRRHENLQSEIDRKIRSAEHQSKIIIGEAERRRDKELRESKEVLAGVYELLGLDESASTMDARFRLQELRREISKDEQVKQARMALNQVHRQLENAFKTMGIAEESES